VAIVVAFSGLSLAAGHRLALHTQSDARMASRAFLPVTGIGLTLAPVVLSVPVGMRRGS
jgi:hypothetical protein